MTAMKPHFLPLLLGLLGASGAALAYDYPTTERVQYVLECMRQHPGPEFEMRSKCSCTLDQLAQKLPLEQFTAMTTATNANSIGGERGNTIRDTEVLQKDIRRFRDLQAAAKQSCFLTTPAR